MLWREQLKKLEQEEAFDIAIFFMQKVIADNTNDMDGYLALIYLLSDTMIEPHSWELQDPIDHTKCDYYQSKHEEYTVLATHYFALSYFKFKNDAEYLFMVGHAFLACPWLVGLGDDYWEITVQRALELEPDNSFYCYTHYNKLQEVEPTNSKLLAWAQFIKGQSSLLNTWKEKGRLWSDVSGRIQRVADRALDSNYKL